MSIEQEMEEKMVRMAKRRMNVLLRNAKDISIESIVIKAYVQGATDMALSVIEKEDAQSKDCKTCEGNGYIEDRLSKFPQQIGMVRLPCPECHPISFGPISNLSF